jgi:flavin reductase (DIM6/NTAB) family NADH-FMN oxidoreductase RutF
MGRLDYPLFVVTTEAGGEQSGCLIGFASQVSIHPRRFLVGLSEKNHTYRVATGAERLAVHVLGAGQRDLARLFGEETGDDVDKFARCEWSVGPHGLPVLDAAAGWFTGRVLEQVVLGDHVGFLLEPEEGDLHEEAGPLLTFQQATDLDAGHEA